MIGNNTTWGKLTEQDKENLLMWAREGRTFAQIADLLYNKISRQRIKQICDKHKVYPMEIRNSGQEVFKQEHNEKMTQKWGDNWANKEWRKSNLYSAMRLKFRLKKKSAEYTKHGWDLEFGDIVWPEFCPVLGTPLDYFNTKVGDDSVSFDRIDSEKGYVKGNVAIISWRANRIKNNGTALEHSKIAYYMYNVANSDAIKVPSITIEAADASSKEGYVKEEKQSTIRQREVLSLLDKGFKKCEECEETLPVAAFHKHHKGLTKLQTNCIECRKKLKEKGNKAKALKEEKKKEEDFSRHQALGATAIGTICNYFTV